MAAPTYVIYPGATTYPGSTLYPGNVMFSPQLRGFIDLSGSPSGTPNWSSLSDTRVRAFSVSRGRESELTEFDAGTASLTVDNRDRAFDPTNASSPYYPYIRPMTRFLLQVELSGVVKPLMLGYADTFINQWPNGGWSDAECVISLTDEFKKLSRARLPTTNPPRDSYEELVSYDTPSGYWRLNYADGPTNGAPGTVGPTLVPVGSGFAYTTTTAIVGDRGGSFILGNFITPPGAPDAGYLATSGLAEGEVGDPGGLPGFSFEFWFSKNQAIPPGNEFLASGAFNGGQPKYSFWIDGGGAINFGVRNAAGTFTDTVSGGAIYDSNWHHIVGMADAASVLYLYIDGVLIDSGGWSGPCPSGIDASTEMLIGGGNMTKQYGFDEAAYYRYAMSAGRVSAHYSAGYIRGFPQQTTGQRINAVLDAAGSTAARLISGGARTMLPSYMHGQAPLDEMRLAVESEAVRSAFFAAADGTLTFIPSTLLTSVQATFGDAGGSEISYLEAAVDYSESFLYNEWNVTRDGGLTQSSSDSTSIGKYGKISQSLSPSVTSDAQALTIAQDMLAAYKDPMQRIVSLSFNTVDATVAAAVFACDLMTCIRVLRTPPGGGARLDQTSWIQKISISGDNSGAPWSITWAVSPH